MKKAWNSQVLIVCFAIVIGIAAFGSLFTGTGSKSSWYQSIKPEITPPDWLFGPVWTILFILIALSLYFAWNNAYTIKQRRAIGIVYGSNLILNAIWSFLFFGIRNPRVAFIDIVLIDITIVWAIALAWKLDKKAAYLLIPYLLWVTFAAVLNFLAI